MMTRTLSVLGSTGSIGTQTLEVAASCGHRVAALTAHHNIDLLEQQARAFHPIILYLIFFCIHYRCCIMESAHCISSIFCEHNRLSKFTPV